MAERATPQAAMGGVVTALVKDDDEIAEAKQLGASDAATSSAAFDSMQGRFDIVLNCASANVPGDKVCVCACVLFAVCDLIG